MLAHALTAETSDPSIKERDRLRTLENYEILDTPTEVMFDELARMAASLCSTPIALVSLIDGTRQWFKAKVGLEVSETPRELAFCAHAIQGSEPFVVPNALADPRFASNPLVTSDPAIRFYAGAPLIAPNGQALGTLCVIDRVPRELSAERIQALKLLARHVMAQIELRKRVAELGQANAHCEHRIDAMQQTQQRLDELVVEQQATIAQLAQYSVQTGLANRALFITRLDQNLQSAILGDLPVTVFVLDMQRFALVSEAVGQSHLDELLRQVAQRLNVVFGDPQHVAHLEADRFAALTMIAPTADAAVALLEQQVLPALSAPYKVDDQELRVAFKVGIALMPPDGTTALSFLRRAKTALVKAKESDEAYAVFSAELEARVASIVSLETKLRRALEQQQFELHYQPKVNLSDGTISGVEALLRWRDPTPEVRSDDPGDVWIPPARFVPALEATGLILDVGRWALERAACDHRDWQARGLSAPRIAVNISPLQLRHKHFLDEFHAILRAPGLTPLLDIELTEAVLMEQADRCIESLNTLRKWGVRVAIDDFGSGYSSLRYIARLPIDTLKIDMAFVHAMTKSPDNMGIVSSVISLAHGLRLKTVAEGVETEEQRNLLRLLRCDEMQGYLFSRPVSKSQLEILLSAQGRSAQA
jgi:diguanylate cyclase (GGDEF)-like protein